MSSSPAVSSKNGWDGKLRIGHANGDQQDSDASTDNENENNEPHPPHKQAIVQEGGTLDGEEIAADEDLLADYPDDSEDIELTHSRIASISKLGLHRFHSVLRLCLRQNHVSEIDLPHCLCQTLQELDFYDNLIKDIRGLDSLTKLTSLDLSFNKIKHIKNINHLTQLRDIYFVQNRISTITGLDGLTKLRNLELGGNRIRTIENLETLTALEELWLGKNKISEMAGMSSLSSLKILSIQANRITKIAGLDGVTSLEELYISNNLLTDISGLDTNVNLRVLDISSNPIKTLGGLSAQSKLEELWASSCELESFDEVEKELGNKEELTTVYFEGNPLQLRQPVLYRSKVRLALPRVTQIDATMTNAMTVRR